MRSELQLDLWHVLPFRSGTFVIYYSAGESANILEADHWLPKQKTALLQAKGLPHTVTELTGTQRPLCKIVTTVLKTANNALPAAMVWVSVLILPTYCIVTNDYRLLFAC